MVWWVAGRRRALARAIAIHLCVLEGGDWMRLTMGDRDARVDQCEKMVREWVAHGVLAEFPNPYREAAGGGTLPTKDGE